MKGILAQKPVAFTLDEAIEMVRLCDEAGVKLGVNHNMRYDQSMRALKTLLDAATLGEPVVAEIVMNARPHWQEFIKPYGRIALLNMSIHHLDAFRFLFGDPERILVSVRNDPSHDFAHEDGMAFYVLEYARRPAGDRPRQLLHVGRPRHRVAGRGHRGDREGDDRLARLPGRQPLDDRPGRRGPWTATGSSPRWDERWFPQAFKGTMGQLMRALQEDAEPEISGRTTIGTMALVEAAYRSAQEGGRWR